MQPADAAAVFPPVEPLPGEHFVLRVESPLTAPEGLGLLQRPGGGQSDAGVRVVPCALALSQYRVCVQPEGAPEAACVPLWMIESWRVSRASKRVVGALGAASAGSGAALSADAGAHVVELQTKHVWRFELAARDARALKSIKSHLTWCARRRSLSDFPAFELYRARPSETAEGGMQTLEFGWSLYDPARELLRQTGAGPGQARAALALVELPARADGYTATPTYPRAFVEPASVRAEVLARAMEARSRARVPAITYVHAATGAVLARSSQPLLRSAALNADWDLCYAVAGCTGRAPDAPASAAPQPPEEEEGKTPASAVAASSTRSPPAKARTSFFDDSDDDGGARPPAAPATAAAVGAPAQRQASPSPASHTAAGAAAAGAVSLQVADCRPWSTAQGNAAIGGGYETSSSYGFCRTAFFGIDNIFGVAKAFARLRDAVHAHEGGQADGSFHRALADSQWFGIAQRVLACSSAVAQHLHGGRPALVHCTDGWDRTSQCCATAALLLDPFYRTTVGFCILLDKDFCAFGHKLAERNGHEGVGRTRYTTRSGTSSSDTESAAHKAEVSPIFAQYMDIVYQVLRQYPEAFEFTAELLAFLSEAVYGCLYGTFLCDCEQQRRLEGVRGATASVWTDVLRQLADEKAGRRPLRFLNADYDAAAAWRAMRGRPDGFGNCGGDAAELCASGAPLAPSTSDKRLVLWEDLYLRWDCDEAAAAQRWRRHRRLARAAPRPPSAEVPELEAYLQTFIDAACAARAAELPELRQLEATVAAGAARGHRGEAACAEAARGGWCVFDRGTCYGCYKPISSPLEALWSSKVICTRQCMQPFCADCHDTHVCFE